MNRSASTPSEIFLKPVALSESDPRRQPNILIPRPSVDRFLETFEASLQNQSPSSPGGAAHPALVHNLYGMDGVGKSTALRELAHRVVQGKGNLACVSFGETERIEAPIDLMVSLFEALVAQNNWIFKPKFLVMHERYEKALEELASLPLEGETEVSEPQRQAYRALMDLGNQTALQAPAERSTAAATAQAAAQEQILNVLQQHRSTQHDQSLQTLLLEPLRILTQAFAEALQKRAKRQPVVLVLDTYQKATLAVDTWLWHMLLPQEILLGSGVRLVIASHQRLATQPGWKQLIQGRPETSPVLLDQELEAFDLTETQTYLQRTTLDESRNGQPNELWASASAEQVLALTEGRPYGLHQMARHRVLLAQASSDSAIATSTPEADTGEHNGNGHSQNNSQNNGQKNSQKNSQNNGHGDSNGADPAAPAIASIPEDLAELMYQELSLIQRYLVGLAACCRSFSQDLIDYLLLAQDANFALAVEAECNGFEWLVQQPFVEKVQGCWRLDDVARNVFRQSFLETDEKLFFKVQEQLADYFLARSNEAVPPEASPRQKYQNPIWQRGRAEYLYYLLLSRHPEAEQEFRTLLLESHYFEQGGIAQEPFQALLSEFPLAEHALLDDETRRFLQQIEPVVVFGHLLLNRKTIPYALLSESLGWDEETVDLAVQTCLRPDDELEGLAKFTALFYESKQCLAGEQLAYLHQAQTVAETLVREDAPEFSADLFLWKLGDRFSSLGEYETAIAAYDRALTFTPNNAEAWDNRGSSLGCLGRLDEAITSFDKALGQAPESHDIWHSRGLALAMSKRYDEAIASFDQALVIKEDKHQPWYDKACCYALRGMPTLALESLEKAIALNADYRKMATQDEDLATLRGDDEFKRMVAASA